MLRLPPSGDPYLTELVKILNAELLRKEPTIIGFRHDGVNLHVRFRAALATPFVQLHIQSTAAGAGGSAYDPDNYTSSTEVDCRADRLQDASVADLPDGRFVFWLVPIQKDADGNTIKFDGQGGRADHVSFVPVGV